MPIIITMDAGYHRPMDIDLEEFSNYLNATWQLTYIDFYNNKNEQYEMFE